MDAEPSGPRNADLTDLIWRIVKRVRVLRDRERVRAWCSQLSAFIRAVMRPRRLTSISPCRFSQRDVGDAMTR